MRRNPWPETPARGTRDRATRVASARRDLRPGPRLAALVVVATALAALPGQPVATAHEAPRPRAREIVHAQGYLGQPPAGVATLRTLELAVLGETHRLQVTEWRRFGTEENQEPARGEEPARIIVQGMRTDLQRLRKARPEQRVTLLAERRTGSTDLFLLALDLCPPE